MHLAHSSHASTNTDFQPQNHKCFVRMIEERECLGREDIDARFILADTVATARAARLADSFLVAA